MTGPVWLALTAMGLGVVPAAWGAGLSGPQTPAQSAIARAQATLAKESASPKGHVDLALAYARRARETSDPDFYEKGIETVSRVLAKDPNDFEALKAKAWLLLGQHRFAEARELASALNKRVPDDVMVYGLMTDAAAELGDYQAAEKSAQWMLDLRPGNVPGLTRAAYLRELFGDLEGALELMGMALEQTPLGESEERAWLLTQIGHLELSRGGVQSAEAHLGQALAAFPDYHYALGQMARLRQAQGRLEEALSFERRRYAVSPHPENLFRLAEALERAGKSWEAKTAFADFEKQARAEMNGPDNANRELVFYYLDHANNPAEALRLARREAKVRQDVYTRDALASALHRNGETDAARSEIEVALSVGIRDAEISRRAALIHAAAKDRGTAPAR